MMLKIALRRSRLLAVPGLVCALLVPAATAQAATCGAGYHYSGELEYSSYVLQGLEGELGNEDGQGLQSAYHIINYYDLTDFTHNCNGNGSCWLQAGFGQGNVGGVISPSADHAYFEASDVNAYNVNWKSTSDIAGSTHSAYIVLWLKEVSGGNYLYEADADSTNGDAYLGEAWLPRRSLESFTGTETDYPGSGTCSTLSSPVYYGANATGGYDSGTLIERSTDGSTWGTISNDWTQEGPGTGLGYAEVNGNRSAFKVTQ